MSSGSKGRTVKVGNPADKGRHSIGSERYRIKVVMVKPGVVVIYAAQTLEGCELESMEPPRRDSEWYRALEMNFDGYKDIYILTNWGATGSESGCVWLYDPSSG